MKLKDSAPLHLVTFGEACEQFITDSNEAKPNQPDVWFSDMLNLVFMSILQTSQPKMEAEMAKGIAELALQSIGKTAGVLLQIRVKQGSLSRVLGPDGKPVKKETMN